MPFMSSRVSGSGLLARRKSSFMKSSVHFSISSMLTLRCRSCCIIPAMYAANSSVFSKPAGFDYGLYEALVAETAQVLSKENSAGQTVVHALVV